MAASLRGTVLLVWGITLCTAVEDTAGVISIVLDRVDDITSKIEETGRRIITAGDQVEESLTSWDPIEWPSRNVGDSWSISVDGFMEEGTSAWWLGPNVCTTHEETEEEDGEMGARRHYFRSNINCDRTETMYTCVRTVNARGKIKTITVTRQCCHGYERERGRSGCGKRLELTDLFTTAENVGSGQFARALRQMGLSEAGRKNFTMFAPTDRALRDAGFAKDFDTEVVIVSPEDSRLAQNIEDTMMSHVVPGLFRTEAFSDEQLLPTNVNGNHIRINVFRTPTKVITANCVLLNSTNNLATRGIVHTVNKVLPLVKESLFDIISQKAEFSTLAQLVRKANLESTLRRKGQYTLFAPTNAAFEKLDEFVKRTIIEGERCTADVVNNHLLPNVVCSGVIEGRMRSCCMTDTCLNLTSDGRGGVTVNQVPLARRDVMATNGVLHSIDQVLVPEEGLDMSTEFKELVKEAGLSQTLHSLINFTLFLPSNEAVQDLSEETRNELRRDRQRLANIIKYHIVPLEQRRCDLHNDLELATLDNPTQKILVKEYSHHWFPWGRRQPNVVTVQCVPIYESDVKTCGGVVHLIDKMLVPPAGNVADMLSRDDRFSRLVTLLKSVNLFDELSSLGPITFFAPTNEAFSKMSRAVLRRLTDPEKRKPFLKHHMIHDILCCIGVSSRRASYPSLDGRSVDVIRIGEEVYVDNISVAECDLAAEGGVVHVINSLLPRALRIYAEDRRPWHRFSRRNRASHHDRWWRRWS